MHHSLLAQRPFSIFSIVKSLISCRMPPRLPAELITTVIQAFHWYIPPVHDTICTRHCVKFGFHLWGCIWKYTGSHVAIVLNSIVMFSCNTVQVLKGFAAKRILFLVAGMSKLLFFFWELHAKIALAWTISSYSGEVQRLSHYFISAWLNASYTIVFMEAIFCSVMTVFFLLQLLLFLLLRHIF